MHKIIFKGKEYPYRLTMGACIRFAEQTGRDVNELKGLSDMIILLYCCIVSACRDEGVPFEMGLMEFADGVAPEELNAFSGVVSEQSATDVGTQKKTKDPLQ